MLSQVWSSDTATTCYKEGKSIILIVEGVTHELTASSETVQVTEIPSLRSNQEESDTRFVLYIKYAQDQGFQSAVVKSPDSDVYFILLHYAKDFSICIYLDTGRRVINITEISKSLGPQYSTALLGIYCYTGEDFTIAFKGIIKVRPLQTLERNPKFQSPFSKLGSEWNADEETQNELEQFTCHMYGYPRASSVDEVRYSKLKKMVGEGTELTNISKVDLAKLPPCR